jgi:uncharacterized protein YuzE
MKIRYFEDTDTLYLELQTSEVGETRDLDENTTIDLDGAQNVVAITFEHASDRTDIRHITIEGVAT